MGGEREEATGIRGKGLLQQIGDAQGQGAVGLGDLQEGVAALDLHGGSRPDRTWRRQRSSPSQDCQATGGH